jgi:hypothetical protein
MDHVNLKKVETAVSNGVDQGVNQPLDWQLRGVNSFEVSLVAIRRYRADLNKMYSEQSNWPADFPSLTVMRPESLSTRRSLRNSERSVNEIYCRLRHPSNISTSQR